MRTFDYILVTIIGKTTDLDWLTFVFGGGFLYLLASLYFLFPFQLCLILCLRLWNFFSLKNVLCNLSQAQAEIVLISKLETVNT